AGGVSLDGGGLASRSTAEIRAAGVGFVPEDRHEQGLVLAMTLWENLVLGRQDDPPFVKHGVLSLRTIKDLARTLVRRFDVRARSIDVTAGALSGGNQPKVILARELEAITATAPRAAGSGVKTRPEWLERAIGQGLALLLALVIALGLGSIIILLYGESPLAVYGSILRASTTDKDGPAWVLSAASPLIFSALAVSVCFKGGLFNIGVQGQYLVAMGTAAWAALHLGGLLPGPLMMWAVLLFGLLGGMAYAAIPGALKVKTGAHEVVTTIMMNGIAISLVAW